MSYGLLLLRVVIGLTFFGHGAQKLFGWWGGPGLQGTRGWLGGMGFRLTAVLALLVAVSESSGLLLAFGLATPFAALLVTSAMVVAIATVHWKNGFWLAKQGYEYNLVLIAGAVTLATIGPGRFSLDRAFGWDDNLSGLWWGVGVLALACAGGAFIVTALRTTPPAPEQSA
jgi:putative oxidoreductase